MSSTARRLRRTRLRRIANDTMNLLGCDCSSVDMTIVGADHIEIRHDEGCPAIVGRLYALLPRDFGRCQR